MNFSDITSTVQDAWQFCWPPVLACVIAYFVFRYVYPSGERRLVKRLKKQVRSAATTWTKAKETIAPFGLTTAVPLISFILTIGALYIINQTVSVCDDLMPPYLSYQPDKLVLKNASKEELLLLTRRYSTYYLNSAYFAALDDPEIFSKADREENYANNDAQFSYSMHRLIKWAVVVVCIIGCIAVRHRAVSLQLIARSMLVLLTCILLWGFYFLQILYAQEQSYHREWTHMRTTLLAKAPKPIPAATEEERRFLELIKESRQPEQWWTIDMYNGSKIRWVFMTFFGPDSSIQTFLKRHQHAGTPF